MLFLVLFAVGLVSIRASPFGAPSFSCPDMKPSTIEIEGEIRGHQTDPESNDNAPYRLTSVEGSGGLHVGRYCTFRYMYIKFQNLNTGLFFKS